ncbi:MAG: outer membrane beta-barrel protein [Sphingobacteriales bacterium]
MKKLAWLFAILLSLSVKAQQGVVKGKLKDTLTNQPIAAATITLMTKADSSLVSFTMSNDKGEFTLTGIAEGKYRLLLTHLNYHNTVRNVDITKTQNDADLGTIPMGDKFKTLAEILVEAEAPPVTMKNDTIEYHAGAFKTPPNANVEDMLKKLPGVKVDKDGTVRAQGQKVNKVYVDGKEFFGNDPKIATRNLPADAVDKVQVYDKQSDQAQLTGFDDGNNEKAINLKLKKDKKKGVFGKITAGAGTDGRYEGRFNINSFKGERQISALGMGNNTNAEGFSFMDMLNFSSSGIQRNGGNISINISDNDPTSALMGGNNNTGINNTLAGGINYNDLIGTKTDLRSNYFYSRFNPVISKQLSREYLLPDSSYFYNQGSQSDNISNTHRMNLSLEYRIDSLSSLKISPSLGYQQASNRTTSVYQTTSGKGLLTNSGATDYQTSTSGFNLSNEILYRKKFRTKGRTLSLALNNGWNRADGDGYQQSLNKFFNPDGSELKRDSINQFLINQSAMNSYQVRATYTEPIGKKYLVELGATRSQNNNESFRENYNYNPLTDAYDKLNTLLSNDFTSTYRISNLGAKLRYQKKKINATIGAQWQEAGLEGSLTRNGKDTTISQKFYTILPNARMQYNFTRFRNLSLNYLSSTLQPQISQLQPIPDISNPLNIYIGNPLLDQEISHFVSMNYMSATPFKGTNFFAFLTLRATQHKIVNSDSITKTGVKYTVPVNAEGVYNISGDIIWSFPIKPIKKSTLNLSLFASTAHDVQFVNRLKNNIRTHQLRPEFRFEHNGIEKLNWGINASTAFFASQYSLQPGLNVKYFTHELGTFVNWELPKGFYLATDFNYTINARRADGFNANVPLWNASFSKLFLKYNRGEVKLRVFDILNQNVGIARTSNANYIEDTRINNLKRYFMLSFTYSLSKQGLGGGGQGGMIRVVR